MVGVAFWQKLPDARKIVAIRRGLLRGGRALFIVAFSTGTRRWGYKSSTRLWNLAMARELVWVEKYRFRGWACSNCAWQFSPTGPPSGGSIPEMVESYKKQRDEEFKAHMCAKQPR